MKQETLCAVVEVQRIDEGLKFGGVGGGRFRLFKASKFVFISCSQIAIRIQIADGAFERRIVMTVRMFGVLGDVAGPAHCRSTETGNDKEHFAFIGGVSLLTQAENEGASGHEIWKF